jgi:UDP-N-acetylglucosamine acyltransferase
MNADIITAADIHPTAIVSPLARIGIGVKIGPWCTVGPDVTLADNVTLISHVVVDGHTSVGESAVLHPFCSVGGAPQDLKYKGEPTRCELGARVQVREYVTINRGTSGGGGITRVGDDTLLMAVVHVAHDCQVGHHVVIANNVMLAGHVQIGDFAVLGGGAAIQQWVRIGRAAMIGGLSGVERDVIPFGTVMGNRAWLAGLNVIGLRRRGFDKAQIHTLRQAFLSLFREEDGVFAERLESVRTTLGHEPIVAEILAFMDAPSKRGLIRTALLGEEEE